MYCGFPAVLFTVVEYVIFCDAAGSKEMLAESSAPRVLKSTVPEVNEPAAEPLFHVMVTVTVSPAVPAAVVTIE